MRKTSTIFLTVIALMSALIAFSVTAAPPAEASTTTKYRTQVLKYTNTARAKAHCGKLKYSKALTKAAHVHTKKMVAKKSLSHRLKGEYTLGTRITKAGYKKWNRVGENVAFGYQSPKAVVNAWMKSPGHRANILNCKYKHLGVGVVRAKNKQLWWTQDFGRK